VRFLIEIPMKARPSTSTSSDQSSEGGIGGFVCMAVVELAREAANRFYGSFGFLIVFVLEFVFAAVGLIMMLFGRGAEASRMAAPTRGVG